MANVIERGVEKMQDVFSGDKPPMHIVESAAAITVFQVMQAAIMQADVLLNHASDRELARMIKEFRDELLAPAEQKLKDLLAAEGISVPAGYMRRQQINPDTVPREARFTDQEIAHTVGAGIRSLYMILAASLGSAYRKDLARMYIGFMEELHTAGSRLITLMRERGWLPALPTKLH